MLLLDAIPARGERLFELACQRDLEGIVAQWSLGTYQCDGRGWSWLKIKNPEYSQMEGRHELFARSAPSGSHIPGYEYPLFDVAPEGTADEYESAPGTL